jgi:SAM-dependent methyltransferase
VADLVYKGGPMAVPDARDAVPNRWVYAGLFCVTLATLMHEILLTRIFSVTMWYHFAFMAISIAMFGMTLGAVVVFLRKGVAVPLHARLSTSALGYALSLVVGFLIYLRIPFIGDSTPKSLLFLALSYVIISVPFVFGGITVALVLSSYQKQAGVLYGADLLGAAVGCVLLVTTLDVTDAGSAVFVVGAAAGVGAVCFAAGGKDTKRGGTALGLTVVLVALALWNDAATRRNDPIVRIIDTASKTQEDYRYVHWNSHSRVTVVGDPDHPSNANGWGLSDKTQAPQAKIRQLGMTIDTWAGTVITHFDGDTSKLWYLKDDVTNLAHHLRKNADVFVIGVGGGRDVLSALVFDQKSVTGVEVNRDVLGATTRVFGDFAGHIERHPKVTLRVDEARSYLTRLDRKFDIIQISLIDTWAATAAGAFVLTENSLYTVEGWTTFLNHLTPNGILSVSRWYYPTRPGETIRTASLAREALHRLGVANPAAHVLMVKAPRAQGLAGALGNGVSTILVSPTPFSADDIATLGQELSRLGFAFIATPSTAESEVYSTILGGTDDEAKKFYASYSLDVSAPTDDRPFFFQMLRLRDVFRPLSESWLDPNKTNLEAIRLLVALLGIVSVLTVVCIGLPLAWKAKRSDLAGSGPWLGFFFAIGLGFMFVEISEMQRLMVLLGKPTYALSVVLFTLLVGSGSGSLASGRLIDGVGVPPKRLLTAMLAVLTVFGCATPFIVDALAASQTPVRIAAAATMLLPMGFVMGLPFPLGLRAAASRSELVPWLWGVNGAASVLCSVLATVVALGAGITASFWAGVVCYAGALVAYGLATARDKTTAAPTPSEAARA